MDSPGGVTGGSQDLGVAEETAAGQVTWEGRETAEHLGSIHPSSPFFNFDVEFVASLCRRPSAKIKQTNKKAQVGLVLTCVRIQLPEGLGAGGLDVVDRADVVQAAAGHQVAGGGKGDAHHPGRL